MAPLQPAPLARLLLVLQHRVQCALLDLHAPTLMALATPHAAQEAIRLQALPHAPCVKLGMPVLMSEEI